MLSPCFPHQTFDVYGFRSSCVHPCVSFGPMHVQSFHQTGPLVVTYCYGTAYLAVALAACLTAENRAVNLFHHESEDGAERHMFLEDR